MILSHLPISRHDNQTIHSIPHYSSQDWGDTFPIIGPSRELKIRLLKRFGFVSNRPQIGSAFYVIRLLAGLALLLCWMPTLSKAQEQPILTLGRPIELHLRKATLMLVVDILSVQKNIPMA